MRLAFYAPMKSPHHPSPSGDRRMGRLLMQALGLAGHDVELASRYRSYDRGDQGRQSRLRETGLRLADRLVRSYRRRPAEQRPQLWFTYHLYHKAPDWLGPTVAGALDIPYLAAEASHAPKQAGGRWNQGYRETAKTIAAADLLIGFNEADNGCLWPLLKSPDRLRSIKPFIDAGPFAEASKDRDGHRRRLAEQVGIDAGVPWLAVAAMMRDDQKLRSYRLLAQSLEGLAGQPWRLVVVGDGVARDDVRRAFAALPDRVAWLGLRRHRELPEIFAAADIYAWPAIKEAYGMAFLEAQAAGLPVVTGNSGGVAGVVENGQCGLLVTPGDATTFADALSQLLADGGRRRAMGRAAQSRVLRQHSVEGAAEALGRAIDAVMKRLKK